MKRPCPSTPSDAPHATAFQVRGSEPGARTRRQAKRKTRPVLRSAGSFLVAWLVAGTVQAEHFNISLTIEGSGDRAEAYADSSPPAEGLNPRPVFHGRVGDPLTLQFFMTDGNPHDLLEGVTVRYYVVREREIAQTEVPTLGAGVVVQGTFLLNFKPNAKTGLRQRIRITEPGAYLLRVQSENSGSDHEHFSAIDLKID
jgi:hypothetical protein